MENVFLVYSDVTGTIYLDKERKVYVFFLEERAKLFAAAHTGTRIACVKNDHKKLLAKCYALGANYLILQDGQGKSKNIPLSENRVIPGLYNSELNAAISLLKETREQKYIEQVIKNKFLVPAKICQEEHSQKVLYGIIKKKEDYYFLAFSCIEEYQRWEQKVPGWQALQVNFDVMCQIGKHHGYVINVFGNKLVLPYELMAQYRKQQEFDDIENNKTTHS